MSSKNWFVRMIALMMIALLSGCGLHRESLTYKLWESGTFEHWREPDTNSVPAVHYVPARKDYLVTYHSLRDGDDKPRRRSYFLGDYEVHREEKRKPRLISRTRLELVPVPVNGATNVLPYAAFDRKLTIQTSEGSIGPYALPTYAESEGTAAKTALTPLAVTADVACFSLIVACLAAFAYAQSGSYASCD
jgi:hypothetical protein